MTTTLLTLALLSIASAAWSVWAYDTGRYRLGTVTELAANLLAFVCGFLLVLIMVTYV